MSPGPLLVVGVGNRNRGDDGIGPAVVEAIKARPDLGDVETVLAAGDLSDLIVTWTPEHDVVIVDAMVGGGEPGSIRAIDGLHDSLPETNRPLSSHGFGLVDTLELARLLGRLPRSLTILAVELGDTTTLAPLTRQATAAVDDVVSMIAGRRRPTGLTTGGRIKSDRTAAQARGRLTGSGTPERRHHRRR